MTYLTYLRSPEWKERRRKALKRAEHRCQLCDAQNEPLEVHHRTYRTLFNESVADLTVLCSGCHEIYHQAHRIHSLESHCACFFPDFRSVMKAYDGTGGIISDLANAVMFSGCWQDLRALKTPEDVYSVVPNGIKRKHSYAIRLACQKINGLHNNGKKLGTRMYAEDEK